MTENAKPTILLVDDERDFKDGREATVVRNSADAIEALKANSYDEVWLDFVLGPHDDTNAVASFIRTLHHNGGSVRVGKFIVHSSALGAFQLLHSILSRLGYTVEQTWDTDTIFVKH